MVARDRRADLVMLDDLDNVRADTVIAAGQLVSTAGTLVRAPTVLAPPAAQRASVAAPKTHAEDFEVMASTGKTSAIVATLSKPRFSVWGERVVGVTVGRLQLPDDMIRMAVANRFGSNVPPRVAFLENWGTWRGAFATTVSHDSHNLTIFGRDPADMALAANTLRTSQGGLCVVANGAVIAHLPLPLAGLVSEASLKDTATTFQALREALNQLVDWQPPHLVFRALFGASLVCNAGPRLSDVGLVDVFEDHILEQTRVQTDV